MGEGVEFARGLDETERQRELLFTRELFNIIY